MTTQQPIICQELSCGQLHIIPINKTGPIGIIAKVRRYGGTYAYKDIAFEFAEWILLKLKIFLIKEF